MIRYTVVLSCDECEQTIATGSFTREAYDLASAVGARVIGGNVFCAVCKSNYPIDEETP